MTDSTDTATTVRWVYACECETEDEHVAECEREAVYVPGQTVRIPRTADVFQPTVEVLRVERLGNEVQIEGRDLSSGFEGFWVITDEETH